MESRDLDYEYKNIVYSKKCIDLRLFNIKCKNYEICEKLLPEWWYDWKGTYLCILCSVMFGTWRKEDDFHFGKGILDIGKILKCPTCSDVSSKSVTHPRCDHTLCIKCFKLCYYGPEFSKEKPLFPFPEIEKEYYDDIKNPKFKSKKPLIDMYNKKLDNWYIDEENYLSHKECPICHK
jgi:hypothetical protein